MTRTHGFGKAGWHAAGLLLLGLLALVGCGEQDLYDPPTSPYSVAGRLAMPSETQDVAILDHYAYVAAGQGGVHIVDIADPVHPQRMFWMDTPKFASSVAVVRTYEPDGSRRDIAFVIEGTEGIVAYDATQAPDTLIDLHQATTAYDAQRLCVAQPEYLTDAYQLFLADTWRAITGFLSVPGNPGALDQKARVEPRGYSKDVAMSADNTHVFVADDEMGVSVVDATALAQFQLSLTGNADTPGNAQGIEVEGDFIYVADGLGGLQVFRADEDYLPQPIASLALDGDCLAIAVRDGIAFVAAKDAGLYVIDVRDPYHPASLGNVVTAYAQGVAVSDDNIVCVADRDEGLVVFRGPELPADFTAPAAVTDLSAQLTDTTAVALTWTAPGDDGTQGIAALYHVYYATEPIIAGMLEEATEIARRPRPQVAGTVQSMPVTGLTPRTDYWFALRAEDEAHNLSPLSVLAQARMTAPTLYDGSVAPDSGDAETVFTYRITYRDPEGEAPALHTVVIDGTSHDMVAPLGDYAAGVGFEYAAAVGRGSHEYFFAFDDGHGPQVQTAVQTGPRTPPDGFDFTMVPITVGTAFDMGSPETEPGREADETQHTVTLTRSFQLCSTEVMQITYETVMGWNPSDFAGDARPVQNVTFFDAIRFCNALSVLQGYTPAYALANEVFEGDHLVAAAVTWNASANGYRLPTEAEWEYACRAGSTTALTNGPLTFEHCEIDAGLDAVGWYCGNADTGSGLRPKDRAGKQPNAFGLYDLHGNVAEWCWDVYGEYPADPVIDPTGPAGESWMQRVRRGGSWFYFARDCRSAARDPYWPGSSDNTLGFRVARNSE
jgi:formylglycine-generating enzyme required for sulfatase activity